MHRARAGPAGLPVEPNDDRRASMFFHHAAGHNAHQALVPTLARQHEDRIALYIRKFLRGLVC